MTKEKKKPTTQTSPPKTDDRTDEEKLRDWRKNRQPIPKPGGGKKK